MRNYSPHGTELYVLGPDMWSPVYNQILPLLSVGFNFVPQ